MKKSLLMFGIAMATLALAQSSGPKPVLVTEGRGVAESADGRRAEFDFRAAKFVRGDNTRVEGRLEFVQTKNNAGRRVQIMIRNVMNLGGEGNKAEFAGPGVLVTVDDNGRPKRIEGRTVVNVADNRKAKATEGDPDTFRIRFKAANSDLTFEFAGRVGRGDIAVVRPAQGTTGGSTGS